MIVKFSLLDGRRYVDVPSAHEHPNFRFGDGSALGIYTKGSFGILPRRLSGPCGASVVAAQDATPTEQRISTMSLKKLSSNKPAGQIQSRLSS
jgi:hypothetical protein